MVAIFALAFLVRLGVLLIGLANADANGCNPAFLWHDSGQYLQPATALLRHGTYTVDSDGKHVPYCLRPPAYPFFIAVCYLVGEEQTTAILIPQIAIGALGCSLAYWFAAMLFSHRVGLVAGVLMALDQILIAYSNKVMAETFSILFLTASTVFLLLFLANRKQILLWLSGVTLGVCTLSHGSTIYYVVIPIAVIVTWSKFTRWDKLRYIVVIAVACFATTGAWQMRNWFVFGVCDVVPKEHTLVQTAARVVATARSDKSYAELATEAHQHVDEVFQERYGIERPDWSEATVRRSYFPRFLQIQKEQAVQMLRAHSSAYLRAVRSSLLKMTILPLPYAEVCRFAEAQKLDAKEESLRPVMMHALNGLVRGNLGQFVGTVRKVPLCKFFGFGWNAVYWLLAVPAGLVGMCILMRRRNWMACVVLFGTVGYFAFTTSLVQAGDGMQRYRLRIVPYLYCLAAVGWLERRSSGNKIESARQL
jgi:4-amino-4-deoxy-L-arabinose transferase-like glycosyltransferase